MPAEFLVQKADAPRDGHGALIEEPRLRAWLSYYRIEALEVTDDLAREFDGWQHRRDVDDDPEIPTVAEAVRERVGLEVEAFARGVFDDYAIEWDAGRPMYVTGGISHGAPPTQSYTAILMMAEVGLWADVVTDEEIARARTRLLAGV